MSRTVYNACRDNVKALLKHRNRIKGLVNEAIRDKDNSTIDSLTKLYALLYSSYVEVSFIKLIHTYGAFSESEIRQIQSQRNLEEKWQKCVELLFSRINTSTNLGEIANKKQKLTRILKEYIINPSQIRNKVAHGQWVICLNNECTDINKDTTNELQNLDFVIIDRYFSIYKQFQQCILDLSISPKTHYRDYYLIITDLEEYIESTKKWSMESKINDILTSPKYKRQQDRNRK